MRPPIALIIAMMTAACAPRPADAPPPPSRVTYLLGGLAGGPYKLEADLRTGEVTEAKPRPGGLSITSKRTLPPSDLEALRGLAAHVWEYGVEVAEACSPAGEAIAAFTFQQNGMSRTYSIASPCMSDEASELRVRMACGANPADPGCTAN